MSVSEILIRASRDDDSPYLLWSTVTDGPSWIFANRTEAEEWLNDRWRYTHGQVTDDGLWYTPDEVFSYSDNDPLLPMNLLARADEYGSSARSTDFRWEDDYLTVHVDTPDMDNEPLRLWLLPRDRVKDYALALLAAEDQYAQTCLVSRALGD